MLGGSGSGNVDRAQIVCPQVFQQLSNEGLKHELDDFLAKFTEAGFGVVIGSKWEHRVHRDVLERSTTFMTEDPGHHNSLPHYESEWPIVTLLPNSTSPLHMAA